MNKRASILTVLVGATALVAGAMPAFSANTGTVTATLRVPAPPAACITLSGGSVDFGTLSLSDPAAASTPRASASPAIQVTSCSTAAQAIVGAASDAAFPSGGSWRANLASDFNSCAQGPNSYQPGWAHKNVDGRLYPVHQDGTFPSQISLALAVGETSPVTFHLQMACRGSVGAGETASITFSILAALA